MSEPRRAVRGPQRRASRALRGRIGARLREHRRARGWTQQQLAKYCGCSKNFISNLECGTVNATLATLEMLARALHCCESDLLRHPLRGGSPAAPLNPRCAEVDSAAGTNPIDPSPLD
jgi:transcriptional regulator with XRE-family HTH domain